MATIRRRLDRAGVVISGLCIVHCLAGLVLVTVLGVGGDLLLDPRVHEIGLALAVVVGALGLGFGVARHRRFGLLLPGVAGLSLMAAGLFVAHGPREAFVTIVGVALVAFAHWRNMGPHGAHAH